MERLVSLCGLFVMIGLAWLMSSNRRKLNLRIIIGGLLLQFALAFLILRTGPGRMAFEGLGDLFTQLLGFVDQGSVFVFGINPRPDDEPSTMPSSVSLLRSFAFGVLPTIIFFSALMSILYYLGIMQLVVRAAAWVMQQTLGTSGAESLAAAANVFVGHTEAPLVVRPYIAGMTRSELNALMVGGFATVSGGLLAAYHGMGINVGHLITASVISAPAALVIAKVMEPETKTPETLGQLRVKIPRPGVNVIEAAAIGASDGMKLALNVGAVLIAFLAIIALLNGLIGWIAGQFGYELTLEIILGCVFAPLAFLMGIEFNDCFEAGQLLGIKMVANEFVAYKTLGDWNQPGSEVEISERSQAILTYALCGFSNFGAIGIQIGGIGGIAPQRRSDLARLGLRAMLGGMLACCMTACVAGVLI